MPGEPDPAGPVEAIALYDRLLAEYPNYEHNDKVLYRRPVRTTSLGVPTKPWRPWFA